MFDGVVTVFNRKRTDGGDVWYPTVLRDVSLTTDRAAIMARYGAQTDDKALLHVPCQGQSLGGKAYLPPKAWQALEEPENAVTFAAGERFDFFIEGEWEAGSVEDAAFSNGFYDWTNRERDGVYAVSSAAQYGLIPHFEITGR